MLFYVISVQLYYQPKILIGGESFMFSKYLFSSVSSETLNGSLGWLERRDFPLWKVCPWLPKLLTGADWSRGCFSLNKFLSPSKILRREYSSLDWVALFSFPLSPRILVRYLDDILFRDIFSASPRILNGGPRMPSRFSPASPTTLKGGGLSPRDKGRLSEDLWEFLLPKRHLRGTLKSSGCIPRLRL